MSDDIAYLYVNPGGAAGLFCGLLALHGNRCCPLAQFVDPDIQFQCLMTELVIFHLHSELELQFCQSNRTTDRVRLTASDDSLQDLSKLSSFCLRIFISLKDLSIPLRARLASGSHTLSKYDMSPSGLLKLFHSAKVVDMQSRSSCNTCLICMLLWSSCLLLGWCSRTVYTPLRIYMRR
jgi:hypothetical protein